MIILNILGKIEKTYISEKLGLYISNLKVGGWQGNGIIALSPEIFGSKESYQALTGGYV